MNDKQKIDLADFILKVTLEGMRVFIKQRYESLFIGIEYYDFITNKISNKEKAFSFNEVNQAKLELFFSFFMASLEKEKLEQKLKDTYDYKENKNE